MIHLEVITPDGRKEIVQVSSRFEIQGKVEFAVCAYCNHPFQMQADNQRFDKISHRKNFHRRKGDGVPRHIDSSGERT